MAEARNSKDALEKLLARGLRGSLDASGKECPDAGILAAYFDRELSADESARWELHFSTCARCQEQLAVLARTETAASPSVSRSPLRFRTWRWIAPLATAAAAVALWVVMRPAPPGQQPGTVYQETPAVARPGGQPAAAEPKNELADQRAQTLPAKPAEKRAAGGKATAPVAAPTEGARSEVSVPRAEADALAKQAAGRVAEPAPLAGAVASSDERQKAARVGGQEQRADVPAKGETYRVAQAPAPAGEAGKLDKSAVATAAPAAAERENAPAGAQTPEKKQEQAQRSRAALQTMHRLALRPAELRVVAPGGKVMWRYVPGGPLERSNDAGKTWTAEFIPQQPLTAGVCLSEKICWMAGHAGLVLRTADGQHWENLAAPTSANLTAIEARDATHATVTALDGKRYLTSDGGKTWKPAE